MLPVPYFATLPQSLNLWIQNRGHHGISLVHVDIEIHPTQPCICNSHGLKVIIHSLWFNSQYILVCRH